MVWGSAQLAQGFAPLRCSPREGASLMRLKIVSLRFLRIGFFKLWWLWTRWCNCGEELSASAQRNPTETKIATNERPRFVERANVLIALRACLQRAYRASKFLQELPQQN